MALVSLYPEITRLVRKLHTRHWSALCCSTIIVDYAAQDVSPFNRTITCRIFQRNRTPLVNPLMRSSLVVIVNVGRQNSTKVPLPKDQDPVEAFLSNRANPPFGKRIRIGCSHWRPNDGDIL